MTSYTALKQKFHLPSEVEELFDITELDEKTSLKEVTNLIREVISDAAKLLESVAQPDSSFSHMIESSGISNKQNTFELYKQLMYLLRDLDTVLIEHVEDRYVSCISSSTKKWHELKPQVITISQEIRDAWNVPTEYENEEKYFG